MRNQWYPANKAEYMTRQRFRELGLTEEDVGERDRAFGVINQAEEEDDIFEAAVATSATAPETTSGLRVRQPICFSPIMLVRADIGLIQHIARGRSFPDIYASS